MISRFASGEHYPCDMCAATLLPLSDGHCSSHMCNKLPSNRPAFSRQTVAEFHLAVATDECHPRTWKENGGKDGRYLAMGAKEILSCCCCQLHDRASGSKLSVVVQLESG